MASPFLPRKPRPKGARRNKVVSADRNVQHGYVPSFDGTRLFYSVEGEGPPLIFCYGLVCSSLHWTYQIDYFRKNYKTIWFDYRGHQNSDTPKNFKTLTLECFARDVLSILDELQIPQAVLLGHSMGVNVVLDVYRQQPGRVKSMILANGTPKTPLETLFRTNLSQGAFQVLKQIHQLAPRMFGWFWRAQKGNALARALITLGGFNPHLASKEDISRYVDEVAEMDPAILIHLMDNYETVDFTPWLHEIKVPTLIIAGEHDHVTPLEQQELMAQLIPNCELAVIKHGSHCPQMDLPDLVNLRIQQFLSRINY